MAAIDAGKVRQLWKQGTDAQRRLLLNHAVNTSFVLGDQWIQPEQGESLTLKQTPRDPDRVRLTVNRLLPALRTLMAKLHKRPLHWEVPPPAADDASVRMAKVAESIIESTARAQAWERKRVDADWLAFLGGTALISVDWDPKAGQPLTTTEGGKQVGTGDVSVTVSSISQGVVEPGSRDAEFARWWIRGVALPPDEAKDTYGLDAAPLADVVAGASLGQVADVARRQSGTGPDLTLVLHYYRRPSLTDKGEVAVVIGEKVVQQGPWPFPWKDRLNLVVQRETILTGQWFGDTVLSSAVHLQAAYNMAWSSLIEHLKMAGNARGLMPEGNLDLIDELTDAAGEWIPYNEANGKPEWMSPPQLPQWSIDSPALLRRELDDMLGVQDISRGAAPSNIESGLGISILAEQADTPIMQMAVEAADAWGRVASMVLELFHKHAGETRTAKVHTAGKVTEEVTWKGADLEGVTEATIPYDAVMPKSRAAQNALGVKLWELGAITDPEQLAVIADLPDKESFITAINPDAGKAARENYEMATGKECVPAPFDDHEVHRRVHNGYRKSARYEALDDAGKARVDQHLTEHEDMAREEQVLAAAEAMVSPLGLAPPLASEADLAGVPPLGAMPEELMGAEMPPPMMEGLVP